VQGEKEFSVMLDSITPREGIAGLSAEEEAEAGRRYAEYSRRLAEREHLWRADLQAKIDLKRAALAALPERLRGPAEEPDLETFPLDRWVATLTAPRMETASVEDEGMGVGTASGKLGGGVKRR